MASRGKALLSCAAVTAGWGDDPDVIIGIDVGLRSGEIVCVVGPNGAGKSTLLSVLAGVLTPRKGTVEIMGSKLRELPGVQRARLIGYLPQNIEPAMHYVVHEVVMLGRYPHKSGLGFETDEDRQKVHEAMELAGVKHIEDRLLGEISGGERQRVLIASVLAQEPKVLLLDEPTAALDIGHRTRIFETLVGLASAGAAVGVVTHDLNLAGLFADEMVLLSCGEVAARGRPFEVISDLNLKAAYGSGFELVDRPHAPAPGVLPAVSKDER